MSGRRGMPPLRRSAWPSNGPASSRSQARRSSTAASWAPKRRTRPRPSLIATCARFWNARFSTTKTGIDRVRRPVIGPTARWRWQGSKRTSPAAPSSAAASSVDAQPSYRSAPTMAPRSGGHIAAHAIGGPAWRTRRSPRPSAVAAGTQSTRTGSAATRRARVSRFAAAMPGRGELTGGMIPPGRLASQSRNPRGRPPERRRARDPGSRPPPSRRQPSAWCSLRVAARRTDAHPRLSRRARPGAGGAPRDARAAREAPAPGRLSPGASGCGPAARGDLPRRAALPPRRRAHPRGGGRDARGRAPGGPTGADRRDGHGRLAPPRRRGRCRRRALGRRGPVRPGPRPAGRRGGALRGAPRRARSPGQGRAARGRVSPAGRARDPGVRQGDARRGADRRAGADARGRRRPRHRPADRGGARREPSPGGPRARSRSRPAGGASSRRNSATSRPSIPCSPSRPRTRRTRSGVSARRYGSRTSTTASGASSTRWTRPIRLFSRDRRELTPQFPEVVAAFAAAPGRYVLDGEVLAMAAGRALPFLRLQQRLGRLEPTPDVVAAHPVAFVAFDCLVHEDQGLLDEPLRTRRATLETLALPPGQTLAPVWTASERRGAGRPLRSGPGPRQ